MGIFGISWLELMQGPDSHITFLASITRTLANPRKVSDVAGFPTGYV